MEIQCPRGGRVCWLPVRLNGALLGVVILRDTPRPRRAKTSRGVLAERRARFRRECRLLRLLVHDLVTSVKEELERRELDAARLEIDEHRR
jgi:hypothetical protein